uniref:Uncharacterized protein n=1 Tax=Romanomermis culicivorax TaxID=13658 RepID=A0A915KWW7_ROMCU
MINNSDNLCLAQAIVVAIATLNKTHGAYQWDNICHSQGGSHSLQTQRACDSMTRAGLDNHTCPCGRQELEIIQRTLPMYKIKVFSKDIHSAIIYEAEDLYPNVSKC